MSGTATVHGPPRWSRELLLLPGLATSLAILMNATPGGSPDSGLGIVWTVWIVVSILLAAFRAMAHADHLAELLGEPLGTVILTVSAITIEVAAVCAVMLHSGADGNAVVVRDTMFAVLMLILNGLIGAALVVGGLVRQEQEFNLQSSAAYLPLIIALATVTLVLPRFTTSEEGGWMSDPMEVFVGGSSLAIYLAFLWLQTSRHRAFFAHSTASSPPPPDAPRHTTAPRSRSGLGRSIFMLVVALVTVVYLAEGLGPRLTVGLEAASLPVALGGLLIASLVLAPEGLAALKAAGSSDMQRTINVLLGSAVATIGLTVPAVMVFRWITGIDPELGLEPPFIVLLTVTLALCTVNLTRGRVNSLQGLVHLLIFFAWIAVIFDQA